MLLDILRLLNNDEYLSTTLKALTGAYSTEIPFVRYSYIPVTSDKVKAQARFETTAVSNNIGQSFEIINKIKSIILTKGDIPLNDNILSVSVNGGGQLYNEETKTWHVKTNFTITYKERL